LKWDNELELTTFKSFGKSPEEIYKFLDELRTEASATDGRSSAMQKLADTANEMMEAFDGNFKAYHDKERKAESFNKLQADFREFMHDTIELFNVINSPKQSGFFDGGEFSFKSLIVEIWQLKTFSTCRR
jgi:hypothetical protein